MNRLFRASEVEARLHTPLDVEGEPEPLRCFIRIYYVWAKNEEEATSYVHDDVSGEAELLDVGPIEGIDIDELDGHIADAIRKGPGRGVCWRSGRLFFPCDSPEATDEAAHGA
ncbi:MAG: hypothetical protein RRA92_11235 [Gemmatimonadota bacterium]|nr:hypothetical protein [Gemmatimonadota bacterium]